MSAPVPVTPIVADAVDDAGGPERDPDHLDAPHQQPGETEQHQVDAQHHQNALVATPGVEMALQRIIRRPLPVAGNGFVIETFAAV